MRRVGQQFLGHATTDHASAAVATLLADSHARAMPRGDARGANATGAAPDDKQIKIV